MKDSLRMSARLICLFALLLPALFAPWQGGALAAPVHGIAMHGRPALAADFSHFPYANPDAPKGGTLHVAVTGSFDSLNPFIIKGERAMHVRAFVYESLLARNLAEPFSLYGLVARSIDMPDDRSFIIFHIDPKARFADGAPITARDVLFSWKTLRDHGRLNHRTYYRKVRKAEALDDLTVKFSLDGKDRELPLILGLMPVLPEHFYKDRPFERTTLKPVLGSGPYRIIEVKPGQRIIFERRKDYWARDLPSRRGMFNHDRVIVDYYRDNQTSFEALKKRMVDYRYEGDATRWATAYDFPAVKSGEFIKETVPTGLPKPLFAFVFNTRRALFASRAVREAMLYTFDFEWANINLFHKLFARTNGYFDGSELSSIGRPASDAEKALLASVGAKLEPRFLSGQWRAPKSDGSGRDRKNLRRALNLLARAGWRLKGRRLVNARGEPFVFEMLIQTRIEEKLALHWQHTLRLIGVTLNVRKVDSAQFTRRLLAYDYDAVPYTWFNSLSPGNEQKFYWGSMGRARQGTRNYMGVADPAIDAVIDRIIAARDRKPFVTAVRALDRLLTSGFYVLPLYHTPGQWVGRWKRLHRPKALSLYGFLPSVTWTVPAP